MKMNGIIPAAALILFSWGCTLSVAELQSLNLSEGALQPAFSASITSYTVRLPATAASVQVSAIAAEGAAGVSFSTPQPMTLQSGKNNLTVTVTATDGAQKNYDLEIVRAYNEEVAVPGGTFQLLNIATNKQTVSPFIMTKYEIPGSQYAAITGKTDPSDGTVKPVAGVSPLQRASWYAALVFCNFLSIAEGLEPVYTIRGSTDPNRWELVDTNPNFLAIPTSTDTAWDNPDVNWDASGYRLPTEMEWMWAAMGANSDSTAVVTDGVNTNGWNKSFAGFNGSNTNTGYAVFGVSSTEAIGSKSANELGLHDMSGNVGELIWDWDASWPSGSYNDYRGAASGTNRKVKGGNWNNSSTYLSIGSNLSLLPYGNSNTAGFRVVRRAP